MGNLNLFKVPGGPKTLFIQRIINSEPPIYVGAFGGGHNSGININGEVIPLKTFEKRDAVLKYEFSSEIGRIVTMELTKTGQDIIININDPKNNFEIESSVNQTLRKNSKPIGLATTKEIDEILEFFKR